MGSRCSASRRREGLVKFMAKTSVSAQPPVPDLDRLAPTTVGIADWFVKNARLLPWRENPSPYQVWVSEIMLQQTRIEAVMPYYDRFIAALPDIPALAAAAEDRLLKLWEGLGYYRRVRHMQQAARMIVEKYGGHLPADYDSLRSLPGFGEYVAGAVASIAFNLPVPAVDGNVLRVLARLTGYGGDVMQPRVRRDFREKLRVILPPGRAGQFNQGIMELGETVCIPGGTPACALCPAAGECRAFHEGRAAQLPFRSARKPRMVEERTILVILSGERVLLRRRPAAGLLGGMWELPGVEAVLDGPAVATYLAARGIPAQEIAPLPDSRHVFSHREWHMKGFRVRTGDFPAPAGCVWATAAELGSSYALASAFRAYSGRLPALLRGAE